MPRLIGSALVLLVLGGLGSVSAAEKAVLDQEVGSTGLDLAIAVPTVLSGELRRADSLPEGLTCTVIPACLRGERSDDWRTRPDVSGTRHATHIDVAEAAGTPEERRRFRVGGSDGNWDNVSMQWDGHLAIPAGIVALGTSSDDGSRVWIDRNGDDQVQAEEWGENGWGGGQGVTRRQTHGDLSGGTFRLRVQVEEGGGGNACRLEWKDRDGTWSLVPATAFRHVPTVRVRGPARWNARLSGDLDLDLGDGAVLARDDVARLRLGSGTVRIDADRDLSATLVNIADGATLDLAGHRLVVGSLAGAGVLRLGGGTLVCTDGALPATVIGPGTLDIHGDLSLTTDLPDDVTITGTAYRLATPGRLRARLPVGGPLNRIVPLGTGLGGEVDLDLTLRLDHAEGSTFVGVWRGDRHGRWFQPAWSQRLDGDTVQARIALGGDERLAAEGARARWSSAGAVDADRLGLVCYGDGGGDLLVDARMTTRTEPAATAFRLGDVDLGDLVDGRIVARCGQRWELHCRPHPYPADPLDDTAFALDLEVTEPDGTQRRFAGFHHPQIRHADRGDREIFIEDGAERFSARFRPRVPGVHHLALVWRDAGGEHRAALPDLVAEGPASDPIPRPDRSDPRFFSVDGRFLWPLGHNLHSTYDVRAVQAVGSLPTVDRGSFVRNACFDRLIAGGGTACETWLSAWNLGLEWNPRWYGYHGIGRLNAGNAWALDAFLDRAEAAGAVVNLSIFNHGMARDGAGAEMEWPDHPWNRANGGWMDLPRELFTDARAFTAQRRLFRYLTARYADSPALLGWKLWAEVNLAHAPVDDVVAWHDRAAVALRDADPYQRAVTTHWCGDWRNAEPRICAQEAIGYLTIDAYHGDNVLLADLLAESVIDPARPDRGIGRYGKPAFVSEFGGSAFACPLPRLEAEHATGPWVGLVTGHAASPMLWWFEWIDQNQRYGVYRAVNGFLAGEDLRGGSPRVIATLPAEDPLWCRGWDTGTRILVYLHDPAWGRSGGTGTVRSHTRLVLKDLAPGRWTLECWDAEGAGLLERRSLDHGGDALVVDLPAWKRHLACKLVRDETAAR